MPEPQKTGSEMRTFLLIALVWTILFGRVLFDLIRLSFHSELHNHLLLIPFISFYIWRFIDTKPIALRGPASINIGWVVSLAGLGGFYLQRWLRGRGLPVTEYLWMGVLSYLLVLLFAAGWCFGWSRLKPHAFALGFMVFFIPLPLAVTDFLSIALQNGSAEVADWGLRISGLPVLRDGMVFQLPGLGIRVAEECSGVRSTLVLFIVSLVAGKMFLQSPWKRGALALATIPLGLLRNAFRITVLSWLTVNVDRGIINGPLHNQGGPVFFVLSLVPLLGLMWYFKKTEAAKKERVRGNKK